MADKLSEAQLAEYAFEQLPADGSEVVYADWHDAIKASDHPDAVHFYKYLKRSKRLSSALTLNEDGSITHKIKRAAQ